MKYTILFALIYITASRGNIKMRVVKSELSDIIMKYFENSLCITTIFLGRVDEEIQLVLNVSRKVLMVAEVNGSVNVPTGRPRRDGHSEEVFCQENYEGVLIYAENVDVLRAYGFGTKLSPFLSAQNKFFVVLKNIQGDGIGIFFRENWRVFTAPHVVIAGRNRVYFYNPMRGGVYEFETEVVKNNPQIVTNDLLDLNSYSFKTIIFSSLMSSSIGSEFIGIDVENLRMLEQYMNFTTNFVQTPTGSYGFVAPNGTVSGSLSLLVQNKVDLISVSYLLKDPFTTDVEFSTPVLQDALCIVVKKRGNMEIWEIFVHYYVIWIILLGVYFIIVFMWVSIKYFESYLTKQKVMIRNPTFLDALLLILVSSFTRTPKLLSERLFLSVCMLSMITFFGAFQGSLVTILTSPVFYPDIQTLKELSESKIKILTQFEDFKEETFYNNVNDPIAMKLRKMVYLADVDLVTFKKMIRGGENVGIIGRKITYDILNFSR